MEFLQSFGEILQVNYIFTYMDNAGNKEEAEAFANIAVPHEYQVLSVDLPEHGERKREKNSLTHGMLFQN